MKFGTLSLKIRYDPRYKKHSTIGGLRNLMYFVIAYVFGSNTVPNYTTVHLKKQVPTM